jgi:hypothetical protein
MSWFTLDYKERKKKDQLAKQFHVSEILIFILLDADSGEIRCKR